MEQELPFLYNTFQKMANAFEQMLIEQTIKQENWMPYIHKLNQYLMMVGSRKSTHQIYTSNQYLKMVGSQKSSHQIFVDNLIVNFPFDS